MTDLPPTSPGDPAGKPTSAARTQLARIMTVVDANLLGTVHGGVIMRMVDDAAGAAAQRHAGGPAVTAAMDGMTFLQPVAVGSLVTAHAQINWAGHTSMEVGVKVLAEPWNEATGTQHVASAYLVFVALDPDGKPRPIPPVLPEDAADARRFREAEIRRDARLARRAAIEASRDTEL